MTKDHIKTTAHVLLSLAAVIFVAAYIWSTQWQYQGDIRTNRYTGRIESRDPFYGWVAPRVALKLKEIRKLEENIAQEQWYATHNAEWRPVHLRNISKLQEDLRKAWETLHD